MHWLDLDRDSFRKLLGKRLRQAMIRYKIAPWRVAKEVGVDAKEVVRWLYGQTQPDGYQLYRLTMVLGLGILPIKADRRY